MLVPSQLTLHSFVPILQKANFPLGCVDGEALHNTQEKGIRVCSVDRESSSGHKCVKGNRQNQLTKLAAFAPIG